MSPTKRSLGQRVAAYFALLAIAIQCFVVQPHIDPLAVTSASAAGIAQAAASNQTIASPTSQTEHAATCIICQTALTSGAGLASAAPTTLLEHAGVSLSVPLPEDPAISPTPSHAWRSRGPPTLI